MRDFVVNVLAAKKDVSEPQVWTWSMFDHHDEDDSKVHVVARSSAISMVVEKVVLKCS